MHLPTLKRSAFQKLSDKLYSYFQDKSWNNSLPLVHLRKKGDEESFW